MTDEDIAHAREAMPPHRPPYLDLHTWATVLALQELGWAESAYAEVADFTYSSEERVRETEIFALRRILKNQTGKRTNIRDRLRER